jgi:hypothetical protein
VEQSHKRLRLSAMVGAFGLIGLVAIDTPTAEAGQPWSCTCNGVTKRFIASTKACEINLPRNKRYLKVPGGRRLLSQCTRPEFISWNKKACASEGCSLPPWATKKP